MKAKMDPYSRGFKNMQQEISSRSSEDLSKMISEDLNKIINDDLEKELQRIENFFLDKTEQEMKEMIDRNR